MKRGAGWPSPSIMPEMGPWSPGDQAAFFSDANLP